MGLFLRTRIFARNRKRSSGRARLVVKRSRRVWCGFESKASFFSESLRIHRGALRSGSLESLRDGDFTR